MPIYTVHEPPRRDDELLAHTARFRFVRDGFHFWAFLLAPFWMLRHRLWLALTLYVLISVGLDIGLRGLGASVFAIAVVGLLISVLVGLEASTLRRSKLARRRWRNIGVVTGDDLEDAERRFFAAWIEQWPAGRTAAPPPSAPPPPAASAEHSGVIGLFPQPGAQR